MKNNLTDIIKECYEEILSEAELIIDLRNFSKTLQSQEEKDILNNIIIPIIASSVDDPKAQRLRVVEFINILNGKSTPNPTSNNLKQKIIDAKLDIAIRKNSEKIKLITSKLWQFLSRDEKSKQIGIDNKTGA